MLGLMQDHPLLISSIFEHAVGNYGKQEIVSNTVEGGIKRYSHAVGGESTRKVADALKSLNLNQGDKVGTWAWKG